MISNDKKKSATQFPPSFLVKTIKKTLSTIDFSVNVNAVYTRIVGGGEDKESAGYLRGEYWQKGEFPDFKFVSTHKRYTE